MDQKFIEIVLNPLLSIYDQILKTYTADSKELLNRFMRELDAHHHRKVHCLQDLKQRDDKKIHGDLFEEFAKQYFQVVLKIPQVWLLREVPEHHLQQLKLRRQDVGIDILGLDDEGDYYACQAKYKSQNSTGTGRRKISVTWKEISTFFAVAARTGPYSTLIVVTTANYVRHLAPKTSRDLSICVGTLSHISRDAWIQMHDHLSNEIGIRLAMKSEAKTIQLPNPNGLKAESVKAESDTVHSFGTSSSSSDDEIEGTNHSLKRVYFDLYDETKKTWNLCEEDKQNIKNMPIKVENCCSSDTQMDDEKIYRDNLKSMQSEKIRDARLRHFQ